MLVFVDFDLVDCYIDFVVNELMFDVVVLVG